MCRQVEKGGGHFGRLTYVAYCWLIYSDSRPCAAASGGIAMLPISWHEKYKMAYTSPNLTPKWGSMYTMKIIVYIIYLVNNEVKN